MKKALPRNIAGAVVRGPDLFGRQEDIRTLWRLVERGNVLITAPRRYGKTSLMYAMLDDPQPGWRVALIDVEYVADPVEFVTTITAELLRHQPIRQKLWQANDLPRALGAWLSRLLGEVTVGVPDIAQIKLALRESMAHPERWDVLAQQLMTQLGGLNADVLLILDEFPMMIANLLERDQGSALRFLKWFRALRQSPENHRVRFILGGSVNILPRLAALSAEALLNDLERMHLRPFSKAQALDFIHMVLKAEGADVETGVALKILAVTQTGVPYHLQVVVSELLADTRREKRRIQVLDVESVYQQRVIGPENRHRFSHYHSRLHHHGVFEPVSRAILNALMQKEPLSPLELSTSPHLLHTDAAQIQEALVLLEGDHYIQVTADGARFIDGLLRDWWRRNAPAPRSR